ncbi:cysteine-rich repeat secretory protein 4-like [Silene latifolia]|uniref:cysteine-rich repeat secretory protein 4-like n=1 Tax=Silene latifolia TaxID=37657 RepID=UPI003D76DE2C
MNCKQIILLFTLQITIISLLQSANSQEQIDFAGGVCDESENVSTTSKYHNNIISLLDNFLNQSSHYKFFNASSGTGGDLVNGLYVCRPDVSLDTCHSCLEAAVDTFNQYCFGVKEIFIWYQECMLRYSNHTIFAILETKPWNSGHSNLNVSRPDIFPTILNKTLGSIIAKASMPNNEDRFAYDNTTFTAFEGLYGMAWCTPDITPSNCKRCLDTAFSRFSKCCNNALAQRASVHLPSCILKYDTAPFIFGYSPPQLAPSPSPSPSSSPLPSLSPLSSPSPSPS